MQTNTDEALYLSVTQTGALFITDAALCNTEDSVCHTEETGVCITAARSRLYYREEFYVRK